MFVQNVNIEHLMKIFENLISSSNRTHCRKSSNFQRSKFKDFLKTLQGLWIPNIQIKLREKVFHLEGWNEWIQYHFIKNIVGNGLQAHLLENTNLKKVFDIEIDGDGGNRLMSKSEKNIQSKKYGKKQKNMKIKRSNNRKKKNAFIFENNG